MQFAKAGVLALLVMSVALAGCFGGPQTETRAPPPPPPELDRTQQQRLEILAAPEVRGYKLPGSQALAKVSKSFTGTIGPEANAAVQDRNMRGGNDYGVQLYEHDVSDLVPVGQPTALRLTLSYFGSLGSSAQAHIYVCVPGECSYYATNNNDEFNWKVTVETRNVMTIGVSGAPMVVGVAAASGKIVEPLDYNLTVEAAYFADVVTPFHAYAFKVPDGATGVTLRSVKPGQEHLQAKFIVLDPSDQLVTYTEYDDIAVTSESIFIPTRMAGEYVFYAQEMHNGFFSLASDAPLGNDTDLRVLATTETQAVDVNPGDLKPGVIERDPLETGVVTPYSEGTNVAFSVDQGFPLEIRATIGGDPAVTGAVEVRIVSSVGEVYRLQRVARVDTASGSLGYTRDETNTLATWANLAPGSYAVSVVADGETGEIGHVVKTYQR